MSASKFTQASCEITIKNATTAKSRVNAAKILDKLAKNKNASASVFPFVLKNGTFSEASNLAFYLKDNDKIIDAYKKIGTTATADEVNAIIPVVNGLDYNYRKTEVIDILSNINAKYTLKLYDDCDTWEPILSKIRALIDAR